MIRQEYPLVTWRGWRKALTSMIQRFRFQHEVDAHLIILSPSMHRRMNMVMSRRLDRYGEVKGIGLGGVVLDVIEESDAPDGVVALVAVEGAGQSAA